MKKPKFVLMGSLILLLLSLGIRSGGSWISNQMTNTLGDPLTSEIAFNEPARCVVRNTNSKIYGGHPVSRISAVQTAKPDLVVDRLECPTYFAVGERVQVSVVVKNRGTAAAGTSKMRLDAPDVHWFDIPALAPGETSLVDHPAGPYNLAGTVRILATVDANRQVNELDEYNNTKEIRVKVHGLGPDLVASISCKKVMWPAPLWILLIEVTVKNIGTSKTGDFFTRITIDGPDGYHDTESQWRGWLETGETVVYTRKLPYTTLHNGKWFFTAVADDTGKVYEIREDNNTARITYTK
jgi:subtilase family serine protease